MLSLALAHLGYDKMTHLLSLDAENILDFTYVNEEEDQEPITLYVKPAHTLELYQAISYYRHITANGSKDAWLATNSNTFAHWLATFEPPEVKPPFPVPIPVSAFAAFTQQIRCTPTDFPKFTKDSEWSTWNRSLLATATAQNVHHSYKLDYVPTAADVPVFTAIQQYNYSILVTNVQTAFGKVAVREFEATSDAQGVYKMLYNHYGKGVTASIDAQALEEEILGMQLDDKHRKGCEFFLNTWHLKVQDLDAIRTTVVPDPQKRIWLTSALQTHPQMSAAITQASTMEHTMAGLQNTALTMLDFPQFFELCLTAAKHVDKNLQVVNKQKRNVHSTQKKPAFTKKASGKATPSTTPPSTCYQAPPTTSKWWVDPSVWATMTPDAKRAHTEKKKASYTQNQARTANRAAATHHEPSVVAPPATIEVPVHYQPPSTATSVSQPGLREMLSNTANRYPPQDDTIIYGGHTYRRANHTNIQYCIQNFQLSNGAHGSLIDGGANGGFAGADVRVIEYTNDKADVSGIGDTIIKDLDIGTVAGLIQTNSGPVIGIFHQYAFMMKTALFMLQISSMRSTLMSMRSLNGHPASKASKALSPLKAMKSSSRSSLACPTCP